MYKRQDMSAFNLRMSNLKFVIPMIVALVSVVISAIILVVSGLLSKDQFGGDMSSVENIIALVFLGIGALAFAVGIFFRKA